MFCTNTLTDFLNVKDKRCACSAYLHIQKPMTFVLKSKHCCVLDYPLHRRLEFTGQRSFSPLFKFICGALCTDTHTEHALQNPQGITRIRGTLRDSLHYNYTTTVIVSKVAELMVRTAVFVLPRKCIQTGQKYVRCISKIFSLLSVEPFTYSTLFCWVTTAGQISRSLPKRMHKSNSTVHETASQMVNSFSLAAGCRWRRHGWRTKRGFRLTIAADCAEPSHLLRYSLPCVVK